MDVKICPKCGTENDRLFVSCKKCGEPLPLDQATIEKNPVVSLLKTIATIAYLVGFIGGLFCGTLLGDGFHFGFALIYWTAGFIAGSMLLGFAEIVRLLHEINQKTKG